MTFTSLEIATGVVFLALQIADVWTTIRALKLGATEANPVVAWLMEKTGSGWPFVKLAGAVAGAYTAWAGGGLWVVWVLCAIYVYVVYSNWQIIK